MRIILVRHGLTEYNTDSRIQGHRDIDLSEVGREQARAVSERLTSRRIDAAYSSDLLRAAQTAREIASRHGLEVRADPRLRECSFGEWEGLTVTEAGERYPELWAAYRQDSITNRAPGGERLEELQARVVALIEEIASLHEEGTVLVVTHGGPIKAFVCHAIGAPLKTFRSISLENTSLTTLFRRRDASWVLETLNDFCHLNGAGEPTSSPEH